MLATPSMLQSGFSRELFEAWAGNRNNTVLIVDFAVQGTLARQLQDSPQTVTTRDNRPVGGGGWGGGEDKRLVGGEKVRVWRLGIWVCKRNDTAAAGQSL